MATVGGFNWGAFNKLLKKQRAARKAKAKKTGGSTGQRSNPWRAYVGQQRRK
jgi:hypothetical protein